MITHKKLFLVLFLSLFLSACSTKSQDTITVASKDFTESIIVGELYKQALEEAGLKVKHQKALGASKILLAAMESGEVDIISEYTSTGVTVILNESPEFDPDKAYAIAKEGYEKTYAATWLKMSGLNNSQCIAVTDSISKSLNFTKLSELPEKAGDIRFAATAEFEERDDGLKGLRDKLGTIEFEDITIFDKGIKYEVLRNGEADMNVCFTTDADLAKGDIKLIEDDILFWPPYHLAPVVSLETLEKHPEIEDILNKISDNLTTESIQVLNAQVDIDGLEYDVVAHDALQSWGLLP